MFGAHYFGQEEPAVVLLNLVAVDSGPPPAPPVFYDPTIRNGGGWTHRAPVSLPERKRPEALKPIPFKKPNPYRW